MLKATKLESELYDRDKMMMVILTESFKTITRMAEAIVSAQEAVIVLYIIEDKEEKKKCTEKMRKLMEKNKKEIEKNENNDENVEINESENQKWKSELAQTTDSETENKETD